MTWPEIVIHFVVFAVGLPACLRNPTACALVLAWALGQLVYGLTGDSLPLKVYVMADLTVLAVIAAKATRTEGSRTYPTLREQGAHFWNAVTRFDRWIAGLFVFAVWPIYALDIHPFYKWYLLWALIIAQFFLAGCEAVSILLGEWKGRRVMPKPPPGGPGGLAYAARIWRDA